MRTISRDGGIAVRAIVGTQLVAEAARRHDTSPTATAALGRTLLGALLLAADGKAGETVQVQFRGNGPLRGVVAIADAAGRTRGYVVAPHADPPRVGGALDVRSGIGEGVLTVVRQRAGKPPYTGVVQIEYGTIARDLTHYLAESEQSQTAVGLGVQEGTGGERVAAAAGFLVHALPGASEHEIRVAEDNVRIAFPSEQVAHGCDAHGLVEELLDGLGHRELVESEVSFHCHCNADRVAAAVRLLGDDEIARAARNGETLEVRCEFCATRYTLAPDELRALLSVA